MTDIDLDAVPQDVQEALESVAKLGAMGEGIKTELSELLEVFNFSVSMTTNTERKIEETYSEIHFAREQVVASQRMEEEAVVAKHSLQDTIDRSKHKFQEYQTAEINKKDKVVELKANMENLKNKLSKGAGWTPDQEVERKEHITNKENVYRNFDNVKSVLKATRSEVERIEAALELLQRERDLTVKTTGKYERDASDKRDEAKKQSRRKNGLEDSLQNLQAKVKSSREELITREGALKREKSEIVDTEAKLRESKNQMENYLREYDQLFRMTQKLTDDLEVQIHVNDSVDQENGEKTEVLHTRRGEVKLLMKEAAKVAAAKKITSVKIDEIAGEQIVYEKERNSLKEEVDVLVNVDIKGNRKDGEELKKKEATEKRKKETLTRKIGGAEKSTSVIYDLTSVNENSSRNLKNEIGVYMTTVKEQRDKIESLVSERERHEQEVEAASHKHYTAIEELKLQEVQIGDLQKKIIDGGSRLKQQQNLYEAVRSDRNLYSKNLIESQEEIAEMKRRFKVMNHQIEQLKDEITGKDHALVKEHFNHHNVDKEREALKNELSKIRKQILSSEQIIENQKVEVQKLSVIIHEADEERQRQHKEFDAVMSERDILGNQLIKRNAELTKLYEKVKVQRSILHHGELQYQDRVAEINHLTKNLTTLRKEKAESVKESSNQNELKHACLVLERELLHERTKIKALSEELGRPLNVHRWRHLESSNPSRFEMIRKIQSLQKRLIVKTEEVLTKDNLIQEKEKLYVELKNILGRSPGPEVQEQLILYQQNLKEKHKQMKAMNLELEMYKAQVDEYRGEITQFAQHARDLKKNWLKQIHKSKSQLQ